MKKIRLYKGKAGRYAYKPPCGKVWRLGFHIFVNGGDLVFRLCYLRNKKGTHYIQLSIQIKEMLDCAG